MTTTLLARSRRLAACLFILTAGTVQAQDSLAHPPSVARALVGGVLGGVTGVTVGGLAGTAVGSATCGYSNADLCTSSVVGGFAGGVSAGLTFGIPLGVYVASGRRAPLRAMTLASCALFAGELLVLAPSLRAGQTSNGGGVAAVVIGTPLLQLAASTMIARRWRR